MQKRTYIHDLDVPKDDIDCWERYPKHRWVYETSRLLDAQHIKWSPFKTEELQDKISNLQLETTVDYDMGSIYVSKPQCKEIIAEAYIVKGEIRALRYVDPVTTEEIQDNLGDVELRVNAIVSMHFQRFTGVISANILGQDMYSAILRPYSLYALENNIEISKLLKRIYKKTNVDVIGLADQALHETLAS